MMHGIEITDLAHLGTFELYKSDPKGEKVHLESLLPYKVTVTAPAPVQLETHRVNIPGYRAWVDGQKTSVKTSIEGFVTIPIESGSHIITLRFEGTPTLRLSYWAALASWTILLAWALGRDVRPKNLSALSQ
jgi:hypothetical protein